MVPSRFEPCGLTQLYGLRYGTIPVVARTGGLADSVIDANSAAAEVGAATGIVFDPIDAEGLGHALSRAFELFTDGASWKDPGARRHEAARRMVPIGASLSGAL